MIANRYIHHLFTVVSTNKKAPPDNVTRGLFIPA